MHKEVLTKHAVAKLGHTPRGQGRKQEKTRAHPPERRHKQDKIWVKGINMGVALTGVEIGRGHTPLVILKTPDFAPDVS